jgi:DNA (cytosine-5)-methyltransferase 1
MKYLSVCSGIEASTVAWKDLGFEPVAFAENALFPSAVLKHHYPDVPNLGDIKNYKEWDNEFEFDILIGGTPCQSFSVAGLRKGLDDPRGELALVFLGIVDKYKPKWVIWENVFGVLQTNGGKDFGSLLGGMAELGYGFSYRVLDSQFFGVPQHRRRVFLIGYFGDWKPTFSVLFDEKIIFGDSKEMGKSECSISDFTEEDIRRNGKPIYCGQNINISSTVTCKWAKQSSGFSKSRSEKNMLVIQPDKTQPDVPLRLRRITAKESERLQGFPDDYTNIPFNGKSESPVSHRYEALGNAISVPVIKWIGNRIKQFESIR